MCVSTSISRSVHPVRASVVALATAAAIALVTVMTLGPATASAMGGPGTAHHAATSRTGAAGSSGAGAQSAPVATLLDQLQLEYRQGFPSHNVTAARHARAMAAAVATVSAATTPNARTVAETTAATLVTTLSATSFSLQIWPEPDEVQQLLTTLAGDLDVTLTVPNASSAASAAVQSTSGAVATASRLAGTAGDDASAGHGPQAAADLAEAYATFATSIAAPLGAVAPEQVTETEDAIWQGVTLGTTAALGHAASMVVTDLHQDAASLGEVKVSRATIVSDAAIILFREGLEAVLILAAITASFTGERRRFRRLVLAGAGLGLLATAVTYVLAQVLLDALGDGGQRLQAITGIVAIAVLLVVTNWFFHKLYWSEWIARFNRRRKTLEKVEKYGFISGQALGFLILGLTSVYREGFETVLFLQNLQVSAGTSATLLGVGIGMAATLVVGVFTFALGRKLPYKKMLIMTGVLIGIVLAVMVGTTVNNLQGLGWIPANAVGLTINPKLSQWLGLYATWEGIGAQIGALLVVYGSYALARQIQGMRRRRAMATTAEPAAVIAQESPVTPVGVGTSAD